MNAATEDILNVLRQQAWQRAKAELRSVLHTYYPEWNSDNTKRENGYDRIHVQIEELIKHVEDNL